MEGSVTEDIRTTAVYEGTAEAKISRWKHDLSNEKQRNKGRVEKAESER